MFSGPLYSCVFQLTYIIPTTISRSSRDAILDVNFIAVVTCQNLTPNFSHILLPAWVLDNLTFFNYFGQKRKRIKKQVIFDAMNVSGSFNVCFFFHDFFL